MPDMATEHDINWARAAVAALLCRICMRTAEDCEATAQRLREWVAR